MIVARAVPTSPIGLFIDAMVVAMHTGFPTRVFDRNLMDFSDREEGDLELGVYTLLSDGPTDIADYVGYLNVMLVGQCYLGEDSLGSDVEERELVMINEVLSFKRASQTHIDIRDVSQSRQIEVPYGWIRADLRVGPVDLMPPAPDALLDDFVTFHADWDLTPHVGATEHGKWLAEPPDHDTTAPDAADTQTLEQ